MAISSNIKKILDRIWFVLRWTFVEFRNDFCLQRAAALTFATVFAMIPVIALSFSMFTSFKAFNDFFERVRSLIFKHFIPSTSTKITEYILLYSQNTAALSLISLIILIITAVALFSTIEHSFNAIFNIKRNRPIMNKIAYIWSILTLAPLLIASSFYLSTNIMEQPFMERIIHIAFLKSLYTNLIPLILTWITFFLAYQLLPYTKIPIKTSLLSAVVAGSFWECAKYGFDLYVSYVPTYNKIFGSIGIIPIFLLWIFYSWIFVLFGAELTYVLHKPYKPPKKNDSTFKNPEIIAIRMMYHISRQFTKTARPITYDQLAEKIDEEEGLIRELLNALLEKKLIATLDAENESFIPAKPTDQLKISDILKIFKGGILSLDPGDYQDEAELGKILEKIKRETDKITENTTINDILALAE